ncbi:MAG TPA: polysaccharide deacetylase family protein [Myxococcaceae bacterium]|nr:polysaccharide deacetylase family protein [Myxococcaceae bacterium]
MARLASISVDLDSLPHYCRIHGLPESLLDDRARSLVLGVAVSRFRELLSDLSLPATLFVIGEDLADEGARAVVRSAHQGGLEIGNHSFSHDYALTRRARDDIASDVLRGEEAIAKLVGESPLGFRAPGYTLTPDLFGILCERGYLYDSSVFPAAPYYAAKALVMGGMALLGKPSRSILDSPKVISAPRLPYRPDVAEPYREGNGLTLELPIATAPFSRLPFIGTFAVLMPRPVVQATYLAMRATMDFFNFELHGIDLLDQHDGVPAELVRRQPDLRVPVAQKRARLREVFSRLKDDYKVVTLAEAARRQA